MEGEDEDGKSIKKLVSGDWPADGLWAAIPDPGYETNLLLVDEHAVMVSFKVQDNACEMAKEYAEKLKPPALQRRPRKPT